jgi:hypothetical protein
MGKKIRILLFFVFFICFYVKAQDTLYLKNFKFIRYNKPIKAGKEIPFWKVNMVFLDTLEGKELIITFIEPGNIKKMKPIYVSILSSHRCIFYGGEKCNFKLLRLNRDMALSQFSNKNNSDLSYYDDCVCFCDSLGNSSKITVLEKYKKKKYNSISKELEFIEINNEVYKIVLISPCRSER